MIVSTASLRSVRGSHVEWTKPHGNSLKERCRNGNGHQTNCSNLPSNPTCSVTLGAVVYRSLTLPDPACFGPGRDRIAFVAINFSECSNRYKRLHGFQVRSLPQVCQHRLFIFPYAQGMMDPLYVRSLQVNITRCRSSLDGRRNGIVEKSWKKPRTLYLQSCNADVIFWHGLWQTLINDI